MKIAIPLHQGSFSEHFGGAEMFAFYTVDENDRSITLRSLDVPPEHGRGIFPSWLRKQGATVVLAGGMGPRAAGIIAQHGIHVVTGIRGEDPDSVAQGYLDGTLDATGEVCHEHNYHDCGHHPGEGSRGGCRNH